MLTQILTSQIDQRIFITRDIQMVEDTLILS